MNIALWAGAGYVFVGAIVLAWVRFRARHGPARELRELADEMSRTSSTTLSDRSAKAVGITAAVVALLVIWPLVAFREIKGRLEAVDEPPSWDEEDGLYASPRFLKTKLALEDIERAEIVEDPLGGAPPVPFGHLNPAWERFRGQIVQSDEVWSFSAQLPPVPTWALRARRRCATGYALVRRGEVVAEFITSFADSEPSREEPGLIDQASGKSPLSTG